MAVKDKQTIADNMFEPVKATIELLKTYGQELSDDVHLQVQVNTTCSIVPTSISYRHIFQ